jgi:hypothetical protein
MPPAAPAWAASNVLSPASNNSQETAEASIRATGSGLVQASVRSRLPSDLDLQELIEHAQSPQEQLLVAQLMQATTIMRDQEQVCMSARMMSMLTNVKSFFLPGMFPSTLLPGFPKHVAVNFLSS